MSYFSLTSFREKLITAQTLWRISSPPVGLIPCENRRILPGVSNSWKKRVSSWMKGIARGRSEWMRVWGARDRKTSTAPPKTPLASIRGSDQSAIFRARPNLLSSRKDEPHFILVESHLRYQEMRRECEVKVFF